MKLYAQKISIQDKSNIIELRILLMLFIVWIYHNPDFSSYENKSLLIIFYKFTTCLPIMCLFNFVLTEIEFLTYILSQKYIIIIYIKKKRIYAIFMCKH